jgi:hypothetical protein
MAAADQAANSTPADLAVILVTAPPAGQQNDSGAMTKIDGRESVLRAMEMFTNREGVAQTILVIDKTQAEEIKRKIGSHLMFMGIKLVQGGATWFDQLADAQKVLSDDAKHVLVHDAARPSVPYTDLDTITSMAGKHPAVTLSTPLRGLALTAPGVPGPGKASTEKQALFLTPTLYDRATFDQVVTTKQQPDPIHLIEGSALNVRCGTTETSIVNAFVKLLPKPKVKAPSSPFEEAQW